MSLTFIEKSLVSLAVMEKSLVSLVVTLIAAHHNAGFTVVVTVYIYSVIGTVIVVVTVYIV